MEISSAHNNDLPEMIELLKKSLGEGLIPKSEKYFQWKHFDNPFGRSKILLAKEDNKIVGLRAFMKWSWKNGEEIISSVRAVDTATDPAFQGKGIFKKLTLRAVEECAKEGIGLVFNTPNNSSKPGYLKMGWTDEGRMPLLLKAGSLRPGFYSDARNSALFKNFPVKDLNRDYKFPQNNRIIYTPLTSDYISWRYISCPIVSYGSICESGFGVIFRIKKLRQFSELRICEMWCEQGKEILIRKALKEVVKASRPLMVSCAPNALVEKKLNFFGPFLKGPITTIRPLALTSLNKFKNFNSWQPSIGSMELF